MNNNNDFWNLLPSDIKLKILNTNKESERDEFYKNNYDNFINNFKNRVDGDRWYSNDVIYSWKQRYNCPGWNEDINDISKKRYPLTTSIKQISYHIDNYA